MGKKGIVTINGRTVVTTGSGGVLITQDICKVPHDCSAQTFTNSAHSKDAVNTSPNVTINGHPVCHQKSVFSKSKGDEGGSCGGVQSGTVQGRAEFITGSHNVTINGFPAVRDGDLMVSNLRNTAPMPIRQPGAPMPKALQAHQAQALKNAHGPDRLYIDYKAGTERLAEVEALEGENRWTLYLGKPREENTDWFEDLPAKPVDLAFSITDLEHDPHKVPLGKAIATTKAGQPNPHENILATVVPLAYTTPQADRTKAALPGPGFLYLYRDGHLWREWQVCAEGMYKEVHLAWYQGRDERPATAQARRSILIPCRIGGREPKWEVAYSPIPWSWKTINTYGGMHPDDPRLEHTTPMPDADAQSQAAHHRSRRFQKVDLKGYGTEYRTDTEGAIGPLSSAPSLAELTDLRRHPYAAVYLFDPIGVARRLHLAFLQGINKTLDYMRKNARAKAASDLLDQVIKGNPRIVADLNEGGLEALKNPDPKKGHDRMEADWREGRLQFKQNYATTLKDDHKQTLHDWRVYKACLEGKSVSGKDDKDTQNLPPGTVTFEAALHDYDLDTHYALGTVSIGDRYEQLFAELMTGVANIKEGREYLEKQLAAPPDSAGGYNPYKEPLLFLLTWAKPATDATFGLLQTVALPLAARQEFSVWQKVYTARYLRFGSVEIGQKDITYEAWLARCGIIQGDATVEADGRIVRRGLDAQGNRHTLTKVSIEANESGDDGGFTGLFAQDVVEKEISPHITTVTLNGRDLSADAIKAIRSPILNGFVLALSVYNDYVVARQALNVWSTKTSDMKKKEVEANILAAGADTASAIVSLRAARVYAQDGVDEAAARNAAKPFETSAARFGAVAAFFSAVDDLLEAHAASEAGDKRLAGADKQSAYAQGAVAIGYTMLVLNDRMAEKAKEARDTAAERDAPDPEGEPDDGAAVDGAAVDGAAAGAEAGEAVVGAATIVEGAAAIFTGIGLLALVLIAGGTILDMWEDHRKDVLEGPKNPLTEWAKRNYWGNKPYTGSALVADADGWGAVKTIDFAAWKEDVQAEFQFLADFIHGLDVQAGWCPAHGAIPASEMPITSPIGYGVGRTIPILPQVAAYGPAGYVPATPAASAHVELAITPVQYTKAGAVAAWMVFLDGTGQMMGIPRTLQDPRRTGNPPKPRTLTWTIPIPPGAHSARITVWNAPSGRSGPLYPNRQGHTVTVSGPRSFSTGLEDEEKRLFSGAKNVLNDIRRRF